LVKWLPVPSDKVERIWTKVVPQIAKACLSSRGRYQSSDIKKFLLARKCQLWVAAEGKEILAVCVTEIVNYPRKKYVRVMILTGEQKEKWLMEYKNGIEGWAREVGCDGVESLARKGWSKIFKDYDMTHVMLEKEF